MPYIRYLRFLISLHLDPKDILIKMNKLGFEVEREKLDRIKKEMMLPEAFEQYANGEEVKEDFLVDYAKTFGASEFWEYKLKGTPEELEEVYMMMENEKLRLIPLLLRIKGEKYIHQCMKDVGYEYSDESYELLLKLFYNIEEMTFLDWKDYFPKKLGNLLDKPLDYVKMKLKIKPKIKFSQILQNYMHVSYYKSMELFNGIPTKDNISMAKKLSDIAMKAGEKLEKYGTSDSDTFLDDIILEFENAGIEFKGAQEVEEGEEAEIKLI